MKIYQSWDVYLSRVAINRFHLKLFLTSTLVVLNLVLHLLFYIGVQQSGQG